LKVLQEREDEVICDAKTISWWAVGQYYGKRIALVMNRKR
jgi:hypothetical protein